MHNEHYMKNTPEKILFVMQQVTPGTHMDYVYEMARTLREEAGLPLTLLIEKPSPITLPAWSRVQRLRTPVLRIIENFVIIAASRFRGTKIFYIHYSFISAISAGIVTRLFGGTTYYWNAGMPWQYKRPWLQNCYEHSAFKLIHHLVTGAASIVPGYCQLYGLDARNAVVIPNWIDLQHIVIDARYRDSVRQELGIPAQSKLLLFVHKLSKRKGAQLLPEIISQLSDKNVHLVVAGDGPLRIDIETELKERNLTDRVHLLGSVTRTRVAELYQATDIFLLPSEEEGSPHSLIEAMAYGLPFVGFDVGGVRETATAELSEWVVPAGDVSAMAQRVTELLLSTTLYGTTAELVQVQVKRYQKELVTGQFVALFSGTKN